jgi:FO synthase
MTNGFRNPAARHPDAAQGACAGSHHGGPETPNRVTFSASVFIPVTHRCRDACGYCNYRQAGNETAAGFLSEEQVLALVHEGELAGCTEALLVTGDKPELAYPEVRRWLADRHYDSTAHYVYELAERILSETHLYPHSNVGVVGRAELERLHEVNASLGLMLETTSRRLCYGDGAHVQSPDKSPELRLEFLSVAGELGIPVTTGLLLGIGETRQERIDTVLAIKEINDRYGHIQEVIVQNFRPKPATPMASHRAPSLLEIVWTTGMTRAILGPGMNIQVPPNLIADIPGAYGAVLEAGANDWGGVSPITGDCINAEAPWPSLERLRAETSRAGFRLRHRFPVYPEFIRLKTGFISSRVRARLFADADEEGYVRSAAGSP